MLNVLDRMSIIRRSCACDNVSVLSPVRVKIVRVQVARDSNAGVAARVPGAPPCAPVVFTMVPPIKSTQNRFPETKNH